MGSETLCASMACTWLVKGSQAVKSATLEAARLSNRGGGWAPSGWASLWECRAASHSQHGQEAAKRSAFASVRRRLCSLRPPPGAR